MKRPIFYLWSSFSKSSDDQALKRDPERLPGFSPKLEEKSRPQGVVTSRLYLGTRTVKIKSSRFTPLTTVSRVEAGSGLGGHERRLSIAHQKQGRKLCVRDTLRAWKTVGNCLEPSRPVSRDRARNSHQRGIRTIIPNPILAASDH